MPDNQSEKTRTHHDAFISYAQQDKPIADAVCAKLELRGIRCWIAPRDVPPGKDFPEAIIDGIEGGKAVVVIFSSHANSSPHVLRELTNAVNKGRIIIPFRIEDVLPSKSMEYLISVPHWLDAVTPPLEKHIDVLAGTLERIVGTDRKPVICSACHTPISPEVKFCEFCGASTAPGQSPPSPPQDTPEPQVATLPAEPEVHLQTTPGPLTEPEKTAVGTPSHPGAAPSRPSKTIIIAGIILVALVAVFLGYQAGIVSFPDLGLGHQNITGSGSATPSETIDYRGSEARVNSVALTAAPTQTLAKGTELFIDENKDSSTAIVTVQFNGGPGMGLVKSNRVVLTRSDGTVTEGQLNFNKRLSEVQLQGTRGTDRIQVVVTLYSDESRTIVDKLLPYRQYH